MHPLKPSLLLPFAFLGIAESLDKYEWGRYPACRKYIETGKMPIPPKWLFHQDARSNAQLANLGIFLYKGKKDLTTGLIGDNKLRNYLSPSNKITYTSTLGEVSI